MKHDFTVMHGIHKARVEYNKDPKTIGRVRVRIPYLHGVDGQEYFIKSDELPWAYPSISGFSGDDMGSFLIPPVGTYVWVLFQYDEENNPDPDSLVYIGGSCGGRPSSPKKMNSFNDEESDMSMGIWYTQGNRVENPVDVFDGKSTLYPENGVLFKSPKGHTIVYNDTDGNEGFTILDRLGQVIHFACPVSVLDNEDNGSRRGNASALNNTQKSEEGSVPFILIKSGKNTEDPEYSFIQVFRDKTVITTVNDDTGEYSVTESSYSYIKTEVADRNHKTTTHNTSTRILNQAFENKGTKKSIQDTNKDRQILETGKSKVTVFPDRVNIIISEGKYPNVNIRKDNIQAIIDGTEMFMDGNEIIAKVTKGIKPIIKATPTGVEVAVGSSVFKILNNKIELNATVIEFNSSVFKVNASEYDVPCSSCMEDDEEE